MSHGFSRSSSPLIAEALAAQEAIDLALRSRDCEALSHLLLSHEDNHSTTGPLINEIRSLCSQINCVFPIVRRTGNVGHILARQSGMRVESISMVPFMLYQMNVLCLSKKKKKKNEMLNS
ncbi:hypothetical protein Salat_1465200 [Sesamum alatum]|uniref:Uncharacterized protein n=1 Tax=Sesamum alatum TaxID=300844 RepID=A0AAE2CM43_9LAMI|nr:hypothetical protein Salat_1465200 [Sesamum alatum]